MTYPQIWLQLAPTHRLWKLGDNPAMSGLDESVPEKPDKVPGDGAEADAVEREGVAHCEELVHEI